MADDLGNEEPIKGQGKTAVDTEMETLLHPIPPRGGGPRRIKGFVKVEEGEPKVDSTHDVKADAKLREEIESEERIRAEVRKKIAEEEARQTDPQAAKQKDEQQNAQQQREDLENLRKALLPGQDPLLEYVQKLMMVIGDRDLNAFDIELQSVYSERGILEEIQQEVEKETGFRGSDAYNNLKNHVTATQDFLDKLFQARNDYNSGSNPNIDTLFLAYQQFTDEFVLTLTAAYDNRENEGLFNDQFRLREAIKRFTEDARTYENKAEIYSIIKNLTLQVDLAKAREEVIRRRVFEEEQRIFIQRIDQRIVEKIRDPLISIAGNLRANPNAQETLDNLKIQRALVNEIVQSSPNNAALQARLEQLNTLIGKIGVPGTDTNAIIDNFLEYLDISRGRGENLGLFANEDEIDVIREICIKFTDKIGKQVNPEIFIRITELGEQLKIEKAKRAVEPNIKNIMEQAEKREEMVESFALETKKSPSTLSQDVQMVLHFNSSTGDKEDLIYHFDKVITNLLIVMNSYTTDERELRANPFKILIRPDDPINYKPFNDLQKYFIANAKFTTREMEKLYSQLRKGQAGALNRMKAIADQFNEESLGRSLAYLAEKAMRDRSEQFKSIIDPKNIVQTFGLLMVNSDEMFQVGNKWALLEYNRATEKYTVNLHNVYQYVLYEAWWQVYFNDNQKIELWRKGAKTPYGYVNWLDILGDSADPKYLHGEDISLLETIAREYGQQPELKPLVSTTTEEVINRFKRLLWVVISGGNNNWNYGWGIWSGETLDAEKFFEGPLQEAYAPNEMAKTNREIYWFNMPGSTKKEVNAYLLGDINLVNFDGSLGRAYQRNTLAYNNITELSHGRLFAGNSNFNIDNLDLRINYRNTCIRELGPKGHMELFRSLQRQALFDENVLQILRDKNVPQNVIDALDLLQKDITQTREKFLEHHSTSEEDFTEEDRITQGAFSLFEFLYKGSSMRERDQSRSSFENIIERVVDKLEDRTKLLRIITRAQILYDQNPAQNREALKALEVYFTIKLLRYVSNIERSKLNLFDTAGTSNDISRSKSFISTAFAEACQFEDNLVHEIDTNHLSEYSLAIAWFFGIDARNDTAVTSNHVFVTKMLFLLYNLTQNKSSDVGTPQTFFGLKAGLTFLEAGTVEFQGVRYSLIEWMRMNIRGDLREFKNETKEAIQKDADKEKREQEAKRQDKLDAIVEELKKDETLKERLRKAIFNRLLLDNNISRPRELLGRENALMETDEAFIQQNSSLPIIIPVLISHDNRVSRETKETTIGEYLDEQIERLINSYAETKLNQENEMEIQKILVRQYRKKGYRFTRYTMRDYWDHHLRGLFESAEFFQKAWNFNMILKRDKGVLVYERDKETVKKLYSSSRELIEKSPVEWKTKIVERQGATGTILNTGREAPEEKEDGDTLHVFSEPLYIEYTPGANIDEILPRQWYGLNTSEAVETMENIVIHKNVIDLGDEIAEQTRIEHRTKIYKVGEIPKEGPKKDRADLKSKDLISSQIGVKDSRGLLGYGIQTTLRLAYPTLEDTRDTNTYVEPWDPGEVMDFIEFVENYMGEIEVKPYDVEGGEVIEGRRKKNRGIFTDKEMQPILRRAKTTRKRLFGATVGGAGFGALLQIFLRALGLTSQHAMK